MGCCVQAGIVTDVDFLTGTVVTPGELHGHEFIDGAWQIRSKTADWVHATLDGSTITIQGTAAGVPVAFVRWWPS